MLNYSLLLRLFWPTVRFSDIIFLKVIYLKNKTANALQLNRTVPQLQLICELPVGPLPAIPDDLSA